MQNASCLVTRRCARLLAVAISIFMSSPLFAQTPRPTAAPTPRPTAAPTPRPTPAEAEVAGAIAAVFAAAERGDLAALDTLYAGDSLTVGEGAGLDRTWKSYRDHHLAPELKEIRNMHYRPTDIEARVSGNLAWAIFRYTLRGQAGERTLDIVGRGTAILERRGGRWIVRHTQTSGRARRPTDPPPPA